MPTISTPGTATAATSWANVAGTCHIDIRTDVAQDPGFYDGDFIVGGGYATIGANGTEAVAESSAIANVGGVEIEINGNVSNNTENTNTDRCIVGGGDTDGRQNEKSVGSRRDGYLPGGCKRRRCH